MREITLYEMLPEYVSGSAENYLNLNEKISKDSLILEEIRRDYAKDEARYKEEYTSAYKNFLINEYLAGWSFLHMCDGKAITSEAFSYGNNPKDELKRSGWMFPPELMNKRISTIRNITADELYAEHLDEYFDIYFGFAVGEEDSRIDRYYKQAVANYKNGWYYASSVSLFPIIESYHKYINEYNENKVYKIKKNLDNVKDRVKELRKTVTCGVNYYDKLVDQFNELAENNYFNVSADINEEPAIINRNRLLHGIFSREVDKRDCLQLFCVMSNLVFIKQLINADKIMRDAVEELERLLPEESK